MLISGDPKTHSDPPVRAGTYGDQVLNEVFAQVRLLTVGPASPQTILWSFPAISNA